VKLRYPDLPWHIFQLDPLQRPGSARFQGKMFSFFEKWFYSLAESFLFRGLLCALWTVCAFNTKKRVIRMGVEIE
jgi:hypothetical protein